MIKQLVLVGLGGAVGSILRYVISVLSIRWFSTSFPVGTFTVNILGSLLLGLVMGYLIKINTDSEQIRLLIGVGFCGGFTTFSTFAYENITMLQQNNYLQFFSYALLSLILGLLAILLGLWLSKLFI